uniref:Uncharacterized protein n=1 Tax=Tetranychus urticae TaxID=32264 RepID=T1KNW7_TETUR
MDEGTTKKLDERNQATKGKANVNKHHSRTIPWPSPFK